MDIGSIADVGNYLMQSKAAANVAIVLISMQPVDYAFKYVNDWLYGVRKNTEHMAEQERKEFIKDMNRFLRLPFPLDVIYLGINCAKGVIEIKKNSKPAEIGDLV